MPNVSAAQSSDAFLDTSHDVRGTLIASSSKDDEKESEEAREGDHVNAVQEKHVDIERRGEERTAEEIGHIINVNGRTEDEVKNLTPPDSGRSVYASKDGDPGDVSLKSQVKGMIKAPYDADAAPATPDDQLRFEEAHAMQQPSTSGNTDSIKVPSSTTGSDLPSQFIQDTFDDGTGMIGMPPLSDDAMQKQHVNGGDEQNVPSQHPAIGMRNPTLAGMNGEASKDLTFSRRPPMRIDTGVPPSSNGNHAAPDKSATTLENATPSRSAPLSSSAQSPPERMTTRVSSGALRHKSVSEILGETPKSAPAPSDKAFLEPNKDDLGNSQTPKSASSFATPDPTAFKLRLSRLDDKDRSKLSTVVFAKQQSSAGSRGSEHNQSQQSDGEEPLVEERDYFLTFFAAQAFTPPRAPPLSALLRSAHKTLATTDHYTELREKQDFRILSQIKDMQSYGRWSLRQPERSAEPQRSVTHWDILLSHVKWMRTDFREERKFKLAGAKYLAEACAAWVTSSPELRRSLQIKIRRVPASSAPVSASATPELVNDETSEATEEDLPVPDTILGDPPAAIFSLPPDVFVFGLNKSPVAEKLLSELPCYDPAQGVHDAAHQIANLDPDTAWKTRLIPVSKYARGKLISRHEGPPQKKCRIESSDASPSSLARYQENSVTNLAPADEDVALFNPEHKHIRDRIHAGHAFRPPSEYQMPSRDFFECRSPSQWTLAEDDELRKLVREYAYNWSLISSCLASPSMFSSGAERRTPWECFERWISLEGLPAEMSKVPYFRTYHQRLQQAARAYEARQQALIQQQGGNPAQLPQRRRSNQPFTVEKRKNNKPIHLIDAMRKHAKKKEATLHKQQQGWSIIVLVFRTSSS